MDAWWEAFERVIRTWIRADPESMTVWAQYQQSDDHRVLQDMAQRGMVDADSPLRTAVWEAFLYQRAHISAFKQALTPLRNWRSRADRPRHIGLLDVGCGAGSVAFAFDEFLDHEAVLSYRGFDHHPPSLKLCSDMVGHRIESTGGTFSAIESNAGSLPAAVRSLGDVDRVYATFGYALCQRGMTDETVNSLAHDLVTAAAEVGTLRVTIADAPLRYSKVPTLIGHLRQRARSVDELVGTATDYIQDFPALDGNQFRHSRTTKTQVHYLLIDA